MQIDQDHIEITSVTTMARISPHLLGVALSKMEHGELVDTLYSYGVQGRLPDCGDHRLAHILFEAGRMAARHRRERMRDVWATHQFDAKGIIEWLADGVRHEDGEKVALWESSVWTGVPTHDYRADEIPF